MRQRIAAGIMAAAASSPATARADALDALIYGWVAPGLVYSRASDRDTAGGKGFELSFGSYIRSGPAWAPGPRLSDRTIGVGGVYRWQSYSSDRLEYGRRTFAAQVNWGIVGLELGVAHRSESRVSSATTGVHVSPFLSYGVVYAGPQWILPAHGHERVGYEINIGLKLPLMPGIAGLALAGNVGGHGRPLHVGHTPRVAALVRRADWMGASEAVKPEAE